ncbi:hypothetical protein CVT24_003306 [Panaeolus cyanescens]|uniref:DNA-directed RNA polymerase III subunit RPC10 n=1 Tax=Panaeolus cyanescens TaxID=181874 RepID=A0A409Y6T4_9AGAR|nr:hypothetical protein CVT24_003306 [Panaeolus cyanescens]
MLFCPTCANLLVISAETGLNKWACNTCPYEFPITKQMTSRTRLKRKEVDDVLGGEEMWAHADHTQASCDKCNHNSAYFYQLQIRSADEPMTTFYRYNLSNPILYSVADNILAVAIAPTNGVKIKIVLIFFHEPYTLTFSIDTYNLASAVLCFYKKNVMNRYQSSLALLFNTRPFSSLIIQHTKTSHNLSYFTSKRHATTATKPNTRFTYHDIHEALSSTSSDSRLPISQSRKTSQFSATSQGAAEQEWLQEGGDVENVFVENTPTQPASGAFDWRKRASSRQTTSSSPSSSIPAYKRRIFPPQLSSEPDEQLSQAIRSYTEQFLELLSLEEAEDEAVLRERLSTWSLHRLQLEGYCLTAMSAYWLQENQFGRPVATFARGPGVTLPEHKLENGTQVLISRIDPLQEVPRRGSVLSTSSTHISICFPDMFDLDGEWRLDLGRPNLVYERMRSAIGHMNHDPEAISNLNSPTSPVQFILQGTGLRDVLLRSFKAPLSDPEASELNSAEPSATSAVEEGHDSSPVPSESQLPTSPLGAFREDMRIQSWANRYSQPNPLVIEGDPVFEHMNPSQIRAMATMIGQRISLIQGPPGTGKTKTIIETVKLLKLHFEVPQPILLCTYTNVAVDNLVEGLVKAGVKALRVGFSGNVKSSLIHTTLDYKLEQHALHPKLCSSIDKEAQLASQKKELSKSVLALDYKLSLQSRPRKDTLARLVKMKEALVALENRHKKSKAKIYAIQQQMLREVVADADVICTTCVTSACNALNVIDFPVVFLDEASMSTEPASLIPIMKGSQHISLIGDHKQLPPVIVSKEAEEGGLGVSLFERLTEEGLTPSVILDVQYRMHPAISRFPSQEFYNLALSDGTIDAGGNILPSLDPPNSKHLSQCSTITHRPSVVFLDHAGNEAPKGRSMVNVLEAQIVASVVEDLLLNNPQLRGHDIGIIAPYAAQISLLTRMLNSDAKYQARFRSVLGDQRAMHLEHIEVKTVDGFEGREKEVIIFSTVRNNERGTIGFLADKRRLNVGLTRAKRGLFVVGSIKTLQAGAKGVVKALKEGAVKMKMTRMTKTVASVEGGAGRSGPDGERRSEGSEGADVAMPTQVGRGGMKRDEAYASSGVIRDGACGRADVDVDGMESLSVGGGLGKEQVSVDSGSSEDAVVTSIVTPNEVVRTKRTATTSKVVGARRGGGGVGRKGADSWGRYADYVVRSGLVVRLSGENLESALYEHLDASRGSMAVQQRRL